METDQTSQDDVQADAKGQTSEDTPKETAGDQAAPEKEEIDYKVKFSESSAEAQRLLDEKKRLQAEKEEKERELRERTEELERLREENEALASGNPEAYDTVKLKKSLEEIKKQVLIEREERELQDYIRRNPQAEAHKEALRKLGRHSKLSYDKIWAENFKPVYDRMAEKKGAVQSEKGKGNMSQEPSSEIDLEEFNKLPLAKRKAYLKKMGF